MKIELNLRAKPKDMLPDLYMSFIRRKAVVGSTATVDPPPIDTDIDVLCLCYSEVHEKFVDWLIDEEGWVSCEGYEDMGAEFISLKKKGEKINLILTLSEKFYERFLMARNVCKMLNLKTKKERCDIHDTIIKFMDESAIPLKKYGNKVVGAYSKSNFAFPDPFDPLSQGTLAGAGDAPAWDFPPTVQQAPDPVTIEYDTAPAPTPYVEEVAKWKGQVNHLLSEGEQKWFTQYLQTKVL